MLRVAFIFAPFEHKMFEEDVDIVSQEFGTFQPLGIGFAAAIAQRAGHEVMLIDCNAEQLSKRACLRRLRRFDPDVLAVLTTTYMFMDTLPYITYLKRETGLPVVCGNINVSLYPRETLSYPEIDYGIMGSALDALPALLDAIEHSRPIPDVPGLCYKRDGEIVINEPPHLGDDFSRLPIPLRDGLPHPVYHSVMSKRKNLSSMVTMKGCPAACTFCNIHELFPYSACEPAGVVDEMEECVTRHGVREFEIFDPSFTVDQERVHQICRGIVDRGLDVHFAVRVRVDQVDRPLLADMAAAGCRRMLYGIESGSQRQLDRMKKGIDLDQIRRAIGDTQEVGIMALGFFLIGTAGETEETIEETVRFALDLDLDYAQFHKTMAKPQTELGDESMAELGYDYWREYVLGRKPEMRLPSPWTDLSQKEIERATVRAYHRFYMRPRYLAKTVAGIRSVEELMRYLRSGIGLLNVTSDVDRTTVR